MKAVRYGAKVWARPLWVCELSDAAIYGEALLSAFGCFIFGDTVARKGISSEEEHSEGLGLLCSEGGNAIKASWSIVGDFAFKVC